MSTERLQNESRGPASLDSAEITERRSYESRPASLKTTESIDRRSAGHHSQDSYFGANESYNSAASRRRRCLDQLRNEWKVVRRIGFGLLLTCGTAFASGVYGPFGMYTGLNFFAEKHTNISHSEIHCELTPQAPYCVAAGSDLTLMATITGYMAPAIQIFMWPLIGKLSDALGRRNIIIISACVMLCPSFGGAAFIFFDQSLFWYYGMQFMEDIPVGVVWYSYVIDKLEPENVASGFGWIGASSGLFSLLGLLYNLFLKPSIQHAFAVSIGIRGIEAVAVVFFLDESLPPEKRIPLTKSTFTAALPWKGLSILVSSPTLQRITLLLCVGAAVDAGMTATSTFYMLRYVKWTERDGVIYAIVSALATIGWSSNLGFLSRMMGEAGMIFFCRICCVLYTIMFIFLKVDWQVWVVAFTFLGPQALITPSIAALKSRLVEDSEQGLMQGAIATAAAIAGTASSPCFLLLYYATNPVPKPGELVHWEWDSASTCYLYLIMSVPVLIMSFLLIRHMRVVPVRRSLTTLPVVEDAACRDLS